MAIKPTLNNLTTWSSSCQTLLLLPLLLQMSASKTTLLHLYYICTYTIISSPRLFIIWFTSLILKQNSLLLDVVSTKPQIMMAFPRSLSSLTLFMQPRKSLTSLYIPSKFIQWPYLLNFESFSYNVKTILLNSGNTPAISIGLSTKQSTKNQRPSIPLRSFLAKHLGTLARKVNVTIF